MPALHGSKDSHDIIVTYADANTAKNDTPDTNVPCNRWKEHSDVEPTPEDGKHARGRVTEKTLKLTHNAANFDDTAEYHGVDISWPHETPSGFTE